MKEHLGGAPEGDTRLDMGRVTVVYQRALIATTVAYETRKTARAALIFAVLATAVAVADVALRLAF
jgi:hypothetical protein